MKVASTGARIAADRIGLEIGAATLLHTTSLEVGSSEVVAVMGPSGSGKTTLLGCLSGMIVPSYGSVDISGNLISEMFPKDRSSFRRKEIGLIFQDPELLDELNVVENVALPMLFSGVGRRAAKMAAEAALTRVDLGGFGDRRVSRLSGGEAQRVAVARALASSPSVILADEPTASLDVGNAQMVTQLLIEAARLDKAAIVIATHDVAVSASCDRTVYLRESVMVTG